MENFYQKYANYQKYYHEYFDDNEYERNNKIYLSVYVPFIKIYLSIIISEEIKKVKSDNLESIKDYIIKNPISIVPDLTVKNYKIEDNEFVIFTYYYEHALKMIQSFLKFYNLDNGEIKLYDLINAYYMELQRIENEEIVVENYTNYYETLHDHVLTNEVNTIQDEEEFEDKFIKHFIPSLINKMFAELKEGENWDSKEVNFAINNSEFNLEQIIPKIKSFIIDYSLGSITKLDDNSYSANIYSLKRLVDAYYMELQRLEYIKDNTLERR